MIRSTALYESRCFDPYRNLATEQALLEAVKEGQCILYLWQNEATVVIGKNQNPWQECRTALLSREGGRLARRLSGGGAVYHSLGNLNFTFLMREEDYDLDRQLSVILSAVRSFGIPAERSGRNDLLAQGQKFSGNAFYRHAGRAYHHGTLLVDVDTEALARYLSPSKAKLQSKGVNSVRSRVVNLKQLAPDLSVEALKAALRDAFGEIYGQTPEILTEDRLNRARIDELTARNSSWEWNFGQKVPFTFACEGRFAWGGVQIRLDVQQGIIRAVKIYSDALDTAQIPQWERALTGIALAAQAIRGALPDNPDITGLLLENLP